MAQVPTASTCTSKAHSKRCRAPRRGWTLAVPDRQSSWDGSATARLTRVRHATLGDEPLFSVASAITATPPGGSTCRSPLGTLYDPVAQLRLCREGEVEPAQVGRSGAL